MPYDPSAITFQPPPPPDEHGAASLPLKQPRPQAPLCPPFLHQPPPQNIATHLRNKAAPLHILHQQRIPIRPASRSPPPKALCAHCASPSNSPYKLNQRSSSSPRCNPCCTPTAKQRIASLFLIKRECPAPPNSRTNSLCIPYMCFFLPQPATQHPSSSQSQTQATLEAALQP